MTSDVTETDELHGFGVEARRAVARAEMEARELGHDRVGTEHLLLGLMANDGTDAERLLREAGVTLAAARHKAVEAFATATATPGRATVPPAQLPRTERAARALGRAVRFSHAGRSSVVGPDHVLLGVLDVEGTAGQVLRGLGVDVERLRLTLRSHDEAAESTGVPAGEAPSARTPRAICPTCAAELDDGIVYRVVIATGPRGPREVVVYSCGACGRFLGAVPSRSESASP